MIADKLSIGNILGMKQPSLAGELMQILVDYRFEEESNATTYAKAFELMRKFKVTFYDAVYHAVAINRSGTMLTADDIYFRKTSRTGHIALISNWSSAPFRT